MPIKLSTIKDMSRPIKVHLESFDIALSVSYLPAVFTPEMEEEIERMTAAQFEDNTLLVSKDEDTMSDEEISSVVATVVAKKDEVKVNYVCEILSRLIHTWDLTDDEDRALGTDAQTLKIVPYVILRAIFEAIMEDIRPKKKS